MSAASRGALWRMVLPPLIASKAIGLLVPILSVWSGSQTPGFPSGTELRGAFLQWDSVSYVYLAEHGYPAHVDLTPGLHGHEYAFLPGYPMLMRAVMLVVQDAVVAGVLVSAAGSAVALYYVARLVLLERDEESARFAVWCVALYPLAFFMTAVYTEGPFLAAAAASLYHARRGEHLPACAAALVACSLRITGLALLVPLLIEALRHERRPRLLALRAVPIVLVPLPLVLFGLYSQAHSGDLLAFAHAETSASFGHHHLDWPWGGFWVTVQSVFSAGDAPGAYTYEFFLEILFGVGGLLVVIACWAHRLPVSLAAYCTLVWLMAVSINFWLSVPRYELAMFPALIVLADLLSGRTAIRAGLVTASAGCMAFGASLYAQGHWLG